MTTDDLRMAGRLRISGILIILGLLVELISLKWAHPTAFLLFVMVGGLFMMAGMFFFLVSLITPDKPLKQAVPEETTPEEATGSLANMAL